ncbi:MAG: anthranilate synthase component I [Deltaproteobacteria bacterium]|nr:MAG: anthranilate synthase component I [Deltaproteobacteria bacterium]
MQYPDYETFKELANQGNLIPIYREILADTITPVSTLLNLGSEPQVFLLESVEGGEKWGRYTFLGSDPRIIFKIRGDQVTIRENGTVRIIRHEGDPLKSLKEILNRYRPVFLEGLPRFYGGAVGFLGYDMVRFFERLPDLAKENPGIDDAVFLFTDTILIFDNIRHTVKVVACAFTEGARDLKNVYEEAVQKIEGMCKALKRVDRKEHNPNPIGEKSSPEDRFSANMTPEAFKEMVKKAKEYIDAGDIIQVVLSERLEGENSLAPVDLYRALRYVNPSPYLFYIHLGDLILIGSSPEVMVRLEEGVTELRPIAGTRPRGKTEQEDRKLANELLDDPKEKAEHVMLVDLGRNDLGRIARIGSVQVTQLMTVERYSHVMHLVSHIKAQLAPGKDCFDVLRATFPAGTLSGAPKIRAMEIIEELEPSRRGPYGGAVGYFSFTGNMDFCITIRTLMVRNGKIYVQAGAGIVADSDPEAEYQESMNKAKALLRAYQLAATGFAISKKT